MRSASTGMDEAALFAALQNSDPAWLSEYRRAALAAIRELAIAVEFGEEFEASMGSAGTTAEEQLHAAQAALQIAWEKVDEMLDALDTGILEGGK